MTTTVIVIIVGAILVNLVVNYISYRVDREPSVPNYLPNNGVDDESLTAVPALVEKFGVAASSPAVGDLQLPTPVKAFFGQYQGLRVNLVIDLDRKYLADSYKANPDFARIGLMNEEDDLLVRKSNLDNNVYIVGSEDGNPKDPELFATSCENLLAIAWHDKNRLDAECL